MTGGTLASEYHHPNDKKTDGMNQFIIFCPNWRFLLYIISKSFIFLPTGDYFIPHEGLNYLLWVVPYWGTACSLPRNCLFPIRELY